MTQLSKFLACDINLFFSYANVCSWSSSIFCRIVWVYASLYNECSAWQITPSLLIWKSLPPNYHYNPLLSLSLIINLSRKYLACLFWTSLSFFSLLRLQRAVLAHFHFRPAFQTVLWYPNYSDHLIFLMAIAFDCHSLHIDLKILLARPF